jgi:hypothetical protein
MPSLSLKQIIAIAEVIFQARKFRRGKSSLHPEEVKVPQRTFEQVEG